MTSSTASSSSRPMRLPPGYIGGSGRVRATSPPSMARRSDGTVTDDGDTRTSLNEHRAGSGLLIAARRQTGNEVPLQQGEHDHDRNAGQHRAGHDDGRLADVVDPGDEGQPELDGEILLAAQEDQRLQKVVPGREKDEDGQRGQGRADDRQDDAGEDAELARAVDAGGIEQIVRQ